MPRITKPGYLVDAIGQSPPLDTAAPYDSTWVAGKTILITGGASGFGEGFLRKWAANGANVIIGDINKTKGGAVVKEVRKSTGNLNHHFLYCDVTDWQSQADFFRDAVKLSPTGGIDAVVANAGITDTASFASPEGLDLESPPKPNLQCFDVNLVGVLYTAHLALFYLPRNSGSQKASRTSNPNVPTPDRHLLLIGSVASLLPLPGLPLYNVSKHGVLGLFRSLRTTAFVKGIRVNLLCPYFVDTPLFTIAGRALIAGGAMGKAEDVVDAGTRFMADQRIVGRALIVGPKIRIDMDDAWKIVPQAVEGKEVAIWEAYADDYEQCEIVTVNFVRLLKQIETIKGWSGWAYDIAGALIYLLKSMLRR